MVKVKIKNIQKYIEQFDIEKILFKDIGPAIKARGYIKFDEFYKICMWKSTRSKPRYVSEYNQKNIKKISKNALSIENDGEKIRVLCELDGVNVRTASAILSVVSPDKYPVMDTRCVEMLKEYGVKLGKTYTVNNWLKYLTHMKEIATLNGITPRQLDKALFTMHVQEGEKKFFKNLY